MSVCAVCAHQWLTVMKGLSAVSKKLKVRPCAMCEDQCVSCVTILEKMTKVLDKVGEKSNNETSQIYIFSKITGHFGDSSQCLQ